MGEVQRIIHVQQKISPPKNEDDRLPNRHDLLRLLGISGYGVIVRYVQTEIRVGSLHSKPH